MTHTDGRIEMRRARLTPVVMSHDDWPWPEVLVASEVSPRGLYVTAEDRLVAADSWVRVSFRLGTPELFELDGHVAHFQRRRRRTDPGWSGMGVELHGASPLERMRMRELLRGVPPPLPASVAASRGPVAGRRRPGRRGGRRASDPLRAEARWGRGYLVVPGRVARQTLPPPSVTSPKAGPAAAPRG